MCLPLLVSLSRQSTNAAREIRQHSISQLQRFLLGSHALLTEASNVEIEDIFNRVIFPLMDELVKPEVSRRDPQGMPETRLRASALLCKTFMHFEVRDSQAQADIRLLWIQILDLLDRMMGMDKGDQLVSRCPCSGCVCTLNYSHDLQYEAIPESLKNVVLVMNASGILVAPPADGDDTRTERQKTMWMTTLDRMERFLPGFIAHVIPPVPSKSEA